LCHGIDFLFPQYLKQKMRVTVIIFVPDFSGDSRVLQRFLTPMKFIMCLIVPEVKAMCCERL